MKEFLVKWVPVVAATVEIVRGFPWSDWQAKMLSLQQVFGAVLWLGVGVLVSLWWQDYRKLKKRLTCLTDDPLTKIRLEARAWAHAQSNMAIANVESSLAATGKFESLNIPRLPDV